MSLIAEEGIRSLGTVLVTGAAGRLGRRVVERLSAIPDVSVIATARSEVVIAGARAVAVDMADHRAVEELVVATRPETVLHLAGVTGAAAERDPLSAIAVNVGSTRAIAAATDALSGRRIVLASTAAVYGDTGAEPADESDPLAGSSLYARTKVDGEAALREALTGSVALRIANVYGEGFDDSLVARLFRSSASEPVELRAPDRFVRDYVYVDDVVDALLAAATMAMPATHTAVNIGTGRPVPSRLLVGIIARHRQPAIVETEGPESRSVVSITRARALLGFAPRALEETVASLL